MRFDTVTTTYGAAVLLVVCGAVVEGACSRPAPAPPYRTFDTAEDAVLALDAAVVKDDSEEIAAIFGPDAKALIDSSDPIAARQNRQTFKVAMTEGWRLEEHANGRTLVIGNEEWPFPVPLVHDGGGWRFDTAAGKEEVLARRIGRNELSVIQACRAYVAAQKAYARTGHDGKPRGLYAQRFRSEPGRQNGLYWPLRAGQKRSPLGEVITDAERHTLSVAKGQARVPFHGYYYRILTGQGAAAPGGAKSYVVNGDLKGGFALVAWPAEYDVTGIMTFIVNHDGIVHQRDLGPDSETVASHITVYEPDSNWAIVE
jgi:hypothetical protein